MKSLQELQLKEEALPTANQTLEDLPNLGGFTPPPPAGNYRFKLPGDMSSIWDAFDAMDKNPSQRVRANFDRDHPLLITQSPGGKSNGEPFETRVTNNERGRGKGRSVVASDMDYLLRALGEKGKPTSNRGYIQTLQKYAGKEFGGEIRYSWRCNKERDIRIKTPDGQYQVIEGRKGCGEAFYQDDQPKNADGSVPSEITCPCGANLRAWANLDNMRP